MEEPLELPILNDLTMVLGSISQVLILNISNFICHFVCFKSQKVRYFIANSQSKETGVVVDFTEPSKVYENVKQVESSSFFPTGQTSNSLFLFDGIFSLFWKYSNSQNFIFLPCFVFKLGNCIWHEKRGLCS